MEIGINHRTKVSTASDISNKVEEIVNPHLNKSFIHYLLSIGFSIDAILNDKQEVLISSEYFGIIINNNQFKVVEYVNSETQLIRVVIEKLLLPNSLDQFKMILACAQVIRLPRDYRTDEQKLQAIEYLVTTKMEVCYSLMAGADNVEYFNIANASYKHLKEIKQEFSNQARF